MYYQPVTARQIPQYYTQQTYQNPDMYNLNRMTVQNNTYGLTDSRYNDLTSLRDSAFEEYTKGNKDLAIHYLEKSVNLFGTDRFESKNSLILLGRMYRETKHFDISIQRLQQAKNANLPLNTDTSAYSIPVDVELGKTYYEMGDLPNSERSFVQVIDNIKNKTLPMYPNNLSNDFNTANAYLTQIYKATGRMQI